MPSVSLHPDLRPAFDYAVDAIEHLTDGTLHGENLRLGGGTALAALWNHRHSTDLGFVANQQDFLRAYNNNET